VGHTGTLWQPSKFDTFLLCHVRWRMWSSNFRWVQMVPVGVFCYKLHLLRSPTTFAHHKTLQGSPVATIYFEADISFNLSSFLGSIPPTPLKNILNGDNGDNMKIHSPSTTLAGKGQGSGHLMFSLLPTWIESKLFVLRSSMRLQSGRFQSLKTSSMLLPWFSFTLQRLNDYNCKLAN
jgi:hypothetical protein